MMEDIKTLIELVKSLPSITVWILGAYFFYKLFVVGSIYGVIRLLIVKAHDLLKNRTITRQVKIGDYVLGEAAQTMVLKQLGRIADKYGTIFNSEAEFLRKALDDAFDKKAAEEEAQKSKKSTTVIY